MTKHKYYIRQVKHMMDDNYSWVAYKIGGITDLFTDKMLYETYSDTKDECLEKLKKITKVYYV